MSCRRTRNKIMADISIQSATASANIEYVNRRYCRKPRLSVRTQNRAEVSASLRRNARGQKFSRWFVDFGVVGWISFLFRPVSKFLTSVRFDWPISRTLGNGKKNNWTRFRQRSPYPEVRFDPTIAINATTNEWPQPCILALEEGVVRVERGKPAGKSSLALNQSYAPGARPVNLQLEIQFSRNFVNNAV